MRINSADAFMVRVLYVWNTAGAMTPVSDWLNENNHKSIIIMHNAYDKFGMTAGARSSILPATLSGFYETIRSTIESLHPTHIHINSNIRAIPIVRAAAPFTPIIFQYHGSDVRHRKNIHHEVEFLVDKVIVSTPDLKRYGEVFGCPVHESFRPRGRREKGAAILIITGSVVKDKSDIAKQYSFEHGLQLTILDGRKGESVPFGEMPEFLSRFEFFFDFKGVNALSKKAMEAMACGCKVIPEDMSRILTEYESTTSDDYLQLYESMKTPKIPLTIARLALSLPWSKWLFAKARG